MAFRRIAVQRRVHFHNMQTADSTDIEAMTINTGTSKGRSNQQSCIVLYSIIHIVQ